MATEQQNKKQTIKQATEPKAEPMPHALDFLESLGQQFGFSNCSATSLQTPLYIDFYKSWLQQGKHADMQYLADHLPLKEQPETLLQKKNNSALSKDKLLSAFVFTYDYVPHPQPTVESALRVALYAQGEDYHLWFRKKLESMSLALNEKFPEHQFICATDSSPVLERDLAYRAGLGWFGKNTCLIHPKKGSLFFIGEILSTIDLTELQRNNESSENPRKAYLHPELMHDFCGKCQKCIEVCPTGALEKPRTLNANLCISYLTIESQNLPPEPLIEKIGDWFFGCDLCQTACPWNQKIWHNSNVQIENPYSEENRQQWIAELQEILTLSGKQLTRKFEHTALNRARPFGLRRNAIVVAMNQNLKELTEVIEKYVTDPKLGPLAYKAVSKLKTI